MGDEEGRLPPTLLDRLSAVLRFDDNGNAGELQQEPCEKECAKSTITSVARTKPELQVTMVDYKDFAAHATKAVDESVRKVTKILVDMVLEGKGGAAFAVAPRDVFKT